MDMLKNIKLTDLLQEAVQRRASDLHLLANEPPTFRVDGGLTVFEETPLAPETVRDLAMSLLTPYQVKRFQEYKELDFSYVMRDVGRFRINVRWQQRFVSFSARIIPTTIPKADNLGFNEVLYQLTHLMDGLVLLTGPAGSGKSTTLAAMIEIINTERSAHVITIEDPVEFVYEPKKSIIEQREVYVDTRSFANGVKYVLRQDPDVILVGEMRDLETTQAVITAAETGHLVFSTLHTRSAVDSIHRIIDLFPPHHQTQVRLQLASTLRAVVTQQLLPQQQGGRVAAREILIVNQAVSNLIRENEISQIHSQMQMGLQEGMQTMDVALERLREAGLIDDRVARHRRGNERLSQRYV